MKLRLIRKRIDETTCETADGEKHLENGKLGVSFNENCCGRWFWDDFCFLMNLFVWENGWKTWNMGRVWKLIVR